MKRVLIHMLFLTLPLAAFAGGDPLQKTAKQFQKKMRGLDNPRIAVLSFPYHNGKTSSGSSILSERMTTYMAEYKHGRVVERSLLKKIIEEQHLSEAGVVDSGSAQKMGKILGVDVIVTGTLIDLESEETELNARVLRADSGEVLAAQRVVVAREWADAPRNPNQVRESATAPVEVEEKPMPNEAIEIGIPAGRGGGRSRGSWGGR